VQLMSEGSVLEQVEETEGGPVNPGSHGKRSPEHANGDVRSVDLIRDV